MTRAELRTATRAILKEPTAAYWTDADLNTYINDALLVYTSRVGVLTREQTTDMVSGQYEYSLPNHLTIPVAGANDPPVGMTVAVSGLPLSYLPFQTFQLIKGYGAGAALGSVPLFWTLYNGTGDSAGAVQSLQILPTPGSTVSGAIRLACEAKATALSGDSVVPSIPTEDHECLPWGAAARAFLMRGQVEEAAVYQTMFDRRLSERLPESSSNAVAE